MEEVAGRVRVIEGRNFDIPVHAKPIPDCMDILSRLSCILVKRMPVDPVAIKVGLM